MRCRLYHVTISSIISQVPCEYMVSCMYISVHVYTENTQDLHIPMKYNKAKKERKEKENINK